MADYWMKMHVDVINSRDFARLSDSAWRTYFEICLLTKSTTNDGALGDESDIAWFLRKSEDQVLDALTELEENGFVTRTDTGWFIDDYESSQAKMDNTERSARFREKQRKLEKSETTSGVYKIECIANGKIYIGSSKHIETRIKEHFSEGKSCKGHWLHSDFLMYGNDGFRVEILESNVALNELHIRETYWLKQYEDRDRYNTESTGKQHRDNHETQEERKENITATERCTEKRREEKELRGELREEKECVNSFSPEKEFPRARELRGAHTPKKTEIPKAEENPREKRFKPPTVEEVRAYCEERQNSVDAEKFVDFYASKGWMVGSNRMKDWQAAVRTWERKDSDFRNPANRSPSGSGTAAGSGKSINSSNERRKTLVELYDEREAAKRAEAEANAKIIDGTFTDARSEPVYVGLQTAGGGGR